MSSLFGRTEPRLWTKPLRDLTPETSAGFQVIAFATQVLGVVLYPWQKWLLIHALELKEDGSYRFRRVIVLVARQNGKTLLAAVLAAWWVFVDSKRHPDRVPPVKFKVVGTAQTLDIASGPWKQVKQWADPEPETPEEAELAIPMLQAATAKVVDAHGEQAIYARSRAHYEMRAAKNARGKPAARVLMDELREHHNWAAWTALSQTTKAFWSNQLWGISSAGGPEAVVLKAQRDRGLELISEWDRYVGAGIQAIEDYANDPEHDTSIGLFEWSAIPDCPKDDVEGILQANPSIGYGAISVEECLSDANSMPDAEYRTEVLCQWVSAKVDSYIEINEFAKCYRSPASIVIPKGSRTVWGVDTSKDRRRTVVAAAVMTEAQRPFVQVRTQRPGMLWLPDYLKELAEESGQWEVAVQSRGCPAMEFVKPLQDAGFTVHEIDGSHVGIATGRFKDRVRDGQLITIEQPNVRLAIEGGVTARYAENDAWNRYRSVTDVSPAIAETWALYGLEQCEPDPPDPIVMPAEAAVIRRDASGGPEVNILTAQF
jgi:hypothetical protein